MICITADWAEKAASASEAGKWVTSLTQRPNAAPGPEAVPLQAPVRSWGLWPPSPLASSGGGPRKCPGPGPLSSLALSFKCLSQFLSQVQKGESGWCESRQEPSRTFWADSQGQGPEVCSLGVEYKGSFATCCLYPLLAQAKP